MQRYRTSLQSHTRAVFAAFGMAIALIPGCNVFRSTAGETGPASTATVSLVNSIGEQCDTLSASLFGADCGNRDEYLYLIDSAARELEQAFGDTCDDLDRVMILRNVIFSRWKIAFDENRTSLASLMPHTVFREKKGSCVGITVLMLILAERFFLPLHGVMVPGHLFVRFDDGRSIMNIEPMKKGRSLPNDWYRDRFPMDENSAYCMDNLTSRQIAAVTIYNIANVYMRHHQYHRAAAMYRRTIDQMPLFADAIGNLGLCWGRMGDLDSAVACLRQSKRLQPASPRIAHNLGTMYMQQRRYLLAIKEFEEGLTFNPHEASLWYGAALAYYSVRKFAESCKRCRKAVELQGAYPEARQLLVRVNDSLSSCIIGGNPPPAK